ncbi:putative sporulation protein YtxC [Paenibacillus turicensis]|uniref:Sporulation protein YtxC n=1 Tax=Paenibacillus turicensis TaxID=160487 RepID=A0ABS4FRN4_9BACL|nr:putative sporulation protein YtxC [Paenibacillus turicensis]MBP1905253.1 putative sporulation protein YtxC [Paenibacillus turicensis]
MGLFIFRVLSLNALSGQQFATYITKECGNKQHFRLHISSEQDWNKPFHEIQIFIKEEEEKSQLARAVAKYIVNECEPQLVKVMLKKESLAQEEDEFVKLYNFCMDLLVDTTENKRSRNFRIEKIATACMDYFSQHRLLHVEGFISFWLKEYTRLLQDTMQYAIEEYLLDRQYEEFISLLQYFVYYQEPLTPVLHLIHDHDSEFNILNEQFKEVNVNYVQGVVARIADQELEMEDAIVSTLITLSPERIVLHTMEPQAVIITTIKRIFGERVEVCTGCTTCQMIHGQKSTN